MATAGFAMPIAFNGAIANIGVRFGGIVLDDARVVRLAYLIGINAYGRSDV